MMGEALEDGMAITVMALICPMPYLTGETGLGHRNKLTDHGYMKTKDYILVQNEWPGG